MSSVARTATQAMTDRSGAASAGGDDRALPPPRTFPTVPLVCSMALLAFVALPRVHDNARLVAAFAGVSIALLAWSLILWMVQERRGESLKVVFKAYPSHYVQACVHSSVLLYWGWYWRDVYSEIPLILAQVVFLYALDGLLTWSRGRTWHIGFGPFPIIFSTNLFLWFRDDWFILQFVMVAIGAFGKQFLTWTRDGKRSHIFNPSAFSQTTVGLTLLALGMSDKLTLGREIAASFEVPYMLLYIFVGGLVVQYLFHVTLVTFSAAATLAALNLIYTWATDSYYFVNLSIGAPVFLGLHLLVTDPATSPRTNVGKIIFGIGYALGYAALFRLLDIFEMPLFWDKLFPVPVLNLCVPLIDRFARSGFIASLNRAWETALSPKRLNLAHMSVWIALFMTMWGTGFILGDHPGGSIAFWKDAVRQGKPHAGNSLVMAVGSLAEGANSGPAFNELGLICIEGKIVNENHGTAAKYFSQACELGDMHGCVNCAIQYLFLGERRSDEDVARALDSLERACGEAPDELNCFLIGHAYERGRGRPQNLRRAAELYARCGPQSLFAAKGLARIVLNTRTEAIPLHDVMGTLEFAAINDAESCWCLAYIYAGGVGGMPQDGAKAAQFMQRACDLGVQEACDILQQGEWPAFEEPVMLVPGWSTAWPME